VPISAADAITPAFNHTKQQLFQPFRMGQWTRLALVGLLAGEMGSGGCNFNSLHSPGSSGHPTGSPMVYAGLVVFLVVVAMILAIFFLYVSSVMRFVLFDAVVTKECHIRQSWSRRQRPGLRYFVWHLLFMFVAAVLLTILIGIPVAIAFAAGWFNQPKQHLVPLILGGICLFFIFFAYLLVGLLIMVLTKDFVVPQMALEDLSAFEGWRRLWKSMKGDKGNYAAYIGLKILLALAFGIVLGIISVIALLLLAIPLGGASVIAIIAGKTAGLTWDVYTITVAVVVGSVFLAIILYVKALVSVPAIVFFPAYSIHFFASRYRPLDAVLHPAPAALALPPEPPPGPPEPPPFAPDFNPSPT
jgi:hypothetical protein